MVHILGYIENDDLVSIINLASLSLLTSFYEGFGLPILEAQACGVPVITSDISSMKEVGGQSVIYIDPKNPKQISLEIVSLLNNKTKNSDLISAGFENTKRFSLSSVTALTIDVYKKVVLKR